MKVSLVVHSPLAETGLGASLATEPREAIVSSDQVFASVYEAHAGFVWRVLRGMGVTDSQVEDALQEVFIVVHRRLPEFDGRHSIKTWLFAIAFRVACDQRRRLKRGGAHQPIDDHLRDGGPDPAETAERLEAVRILEQLLDQVDEEKRAVLVLAEIEGMTVPEIAAATGIGINTVYTRLRRARLQLNRALSSWQRREP
jgi:RNA polymerase sigma-70 factor, ECF subfamily